MPIALRRPLRRVLLRRRGQLEGLQRAAQLLRLLGRRLALARTALKQLRLPLRHPPPRVGLGLLEPLRGAVVRVRSGLELGLGLGQG